MLGKCRLRASTTRPASPLAGAGAVKGKRWYDAQDDNSNAPQSADGTGRILVKANNVDSCAVRGDMQYSWTRAQWRAKNGR